jgi:hypothetical protein
LDHPLLPVAWQKNYSIPLKINHLKGMTKVVMIQSKQLNKFFQPIFLVTTKQLPIDGTPATATTLKVNRTSSRITCFLLVFLLPKWCLSKGK